MLEFVWVFKRFNITLPNAAFSSLENAQQWIADRKSTGILTRIPLDSSVFEWAEKTGGVPETFHYEGGKRVG